MEEMILLQATRTLKHFPKFYYAKEHLQYKTVIYEATKHNLTMELISNFKVNPNESKRKVLTE